MKELLTRVNELKQIGVIGHTLGDQLEKLRATGPALIAALPWVPFDREGRLLCYAMPVPSGAGYEAIRVNASCATFPTEPYHEFRLAEIQQTVFVLAGRVEVWIEGEQNVLLSGDRIRIPRGSWVRLVYENADCVFHQVPHIAGETDMELR